MQPKIFVADEHDIDHSLIDSDAIDVLDRLRQAGYIAYLVGGSVRDLLIKKRPKDFDISTSAKPEEVKQLFRRQCILIGRRFRLAHVRYGHKIFEVSTFRSGESDSSLIIQDNVWGSPEEDVIRRDFTINGLFYDPATHSVIDYVGGWQDIHTQTLRTIGIPETRFCQDPVRMIRLLKFIARLGFKVDKATTDAMHFCKAEIVKSSPARLLEEMFRMLESGSSASFFQLMEEYGFLSFLFPILAQHFKTSVRIKILRLLNSADKLINFKEKNILDRAVLLSCILFPILEKEIRKKFIEQNKTPHIGDILLLSQSVIHEFVHSAFPHFPRKISHTISFILTNQYRLTPLSGKRHFKPRLFKTKEFKLVLQFLKLRALVDEKLVETYQHWKKAIKV